MYIYSQKQNYCNTFNNSVNDSKSTCKALSSILIPNIDRPNKK